MSLGFFFPHSTVYLVPLYMVQAPIGALDSTKGRAVVQQASANCCKGVYPYSTTIEIVQIATWCIQV